MSKNTSFFLFQRISVDRSKMSEEEAFEHAIEMIQTRQMGFRKAADFFSVSKWKLYKTARKRGIYAEIKKQNQAQVRLGDYYYLFFLNFLEKFKSFFENSLPSDCISLACKFANSFWNKTLQKNIYPDLAAGALQGSHQRPTLC